MTEYKEECLLLIDGFLIWKEATKLDEFTGAQYTIHPLREHVACGMYVACGMGGVYAFSSGLLW